MKTPTSSTSQPVIGQFFHPGVERPGGTDESNHADSEERPLAEGRVLDGMQTPLLENSTPLPPETPPGTVANGPPKPGAFSFSGRATRGDFWCVWVFGIVGFAVVAAICINAVSGDDIGAALVIGLLAGVPLSIWTLAAQVRRCHDLGWSGWVILIQLVPYVGWLAGAVLFSAFAFVDGQPGPNRFGPDPKGRRPPWKQTDTNPR